LSRHFGFLSLDFFYCSLNFVDRRCRRERKRKGPSDKQLSNLDLGRGKRTKSPTLPQPESTNGLGYMFIVFVTILPPLSTSVLPRPSIYILYFFYFCCCDGEEGEGWRGVARTSGRVRLRLSICMYTYVYVSVCT